MKAILLSGGIESTAVAYWLRPQFAVTVDYGQPAAATEIKAAQSVSDQLDISLQVIKIDLYQQKPKTACPPREAHSVWWPYRNQLLVTLAAATTSEKAVDTIYLGLVKGDIYKDCSSEFLKALNAVMRLQERKVRIEAPARSMTTLDLLKKSKIPYAWLGITISCHVGNSPCGLCAGCLKAMRTKATYKNWSKA